MKRGLSDQDWPMLAKILGLMMLIFCVIYLSALTNFSLSIDDERAATRINPNEWIGQGRWVIYLIEKYIVTQPTLVFFPLFIFGTLTSLAYIVFLRAWIIPLNDPRPYLVFVLFCAFPTLFFITNFAANLVGLGLGLLASCLSIRAFAMYIEDRHKYRIYAPNGFLFLACQVILTSFAIGSYQGLALFLAAGYLSICLKEITKDGKTYYRHIFWIHTYAILAVALGLMLSEAISHAMKIVLSQRSNYIDGMIRIDVLLDDPLGVTRQVLRGYSEIYGGMPNVYGFRYPTIPALMVVGAAAIVTTVRSEFLLRRVLISMYLVGLSFVPFALNFVAKGQLPFRALVALPMVVSIFALGSVFSTHRILRFIGIVLTVVIGLQSIYTLSLLQTNRRLALSHDQQLASRIYARMGSSIPGFTLAKIYPVDFYGSIGFDSIYPDMWSSTYSASFFEWSGGSNERILDFMHINGYSNLRMMSPTERLRTLPAIMKMPVWPAPGSVKLVDGSILVRLGPNPSSTHTDLFPLLNTSNISPGTVYQIFSGPSGRYEVFHASATKDKDDLLHVGPGNDVQIIFSSGQQPALRNCSLLRIRAIVLANTDEISQLFFAANGTTNFSEANSQRARILAGESTIANFIVSSPTGFQDRFRLDPVRGTLPAQISKLELQCLNTLQRSAP